MPMHRHAGMCDESRSFVTGLAGCNDCKNEEIMVILLKVDLSKHPAKKVAFVFCPKCRKQLGRRKRSFLEPFMLD